MCFFMTSIFIITAVVLVCVFTVGSNLSASILTMAIFIVTLYIVMCC